MRQILFFLLITYLFSCKWETHPIDTTKLSGYWEIERVEFPNSESKEYSYSTLVDYFYLNDSVGFRKKVQPQFDATYLTSKDQENFTLISRQDTLFLNYQTDLDSWSEKLIQLTKEQLILENNDGIRYVYRPNRTLEVLDAIESN